MLGSGISKQQRKRRKSVQLQLRFWLRTSWLFVVWAFPLSPYSRVFYPTCRSVLPDLPSTRHRVVCSVSRIWKGLNVRQGKRFPRMLNVIRSVVYYYMFSGDVNSVSVIYRRSFSFPAKKSSFDFKEVEKFLKAWKSDHYYHYCDAFFGVFIYI